MNKIIEDCRSIASFIRSKIKRDRMSSSGLKF
nr:MAG TPA: hypothetical protein [Caudoviricetes sp.]